MTRDERLERLLSKGCSVEKEGVGKTSGHEAVPLPVREREGIIRCRSRQSIVDRHTSAAHSVKL